MPEETKNLLDVLLSVLGGFGALAAYVHTLRTWRESQRWSRADKLDKLIEAFERDPLLRLGCLVIDWTYRTTEFAGKEFKYTNEDVLLALRLHGEDAAGRPRLFSPAQAQIRDAYDALLTFFTRLGAAVEGGLIDIDPTRKYFGYWLEVMLTMKHHEDDSNALNGVSPTRALLDYIATYGSRETIANLAKVMQVQVPELS